MPHRRNRSLACWSLLFLIVSSGCRAQPECDSIDTRRAVLQFVSDDRNNPLLDFANKSSTANKDNATATGDRSTKREGPKPLYQLGQRIVTTSTSRDKLTLKCSGPLSVSVDDIKATKEITFSVQQSPDGKLSVSVDPFQF